LQENIDIDLELARLRYPQDTKERLDEKVKDYRPIVLEALTSLKNRYSEESEVSHFKRIQEFCMQANIIFELGDEIPKRVHMQKIQQFCFVISKMFMPLDNDTSGTYDTGENHIKEMVDFYWFLNMTLTSMKTKFPHETKEYHIKEMEDYLWFVDMTFNSAGNIDQSQAKKIKEYWE
jgi:predicted DNA-binding protein